MDNRQMLEQRAIEYCERYGIVQYKITGANLVFNVSYREYLNNPRYTVRHTVDLLTMHETTELLKRFDSKGLLNR